MNHTSREMDSWARVGPAAVRNASNLSWGPCSHKRPPVESVPLRPRPTQEAAVVRTQEGEDEGASEDNFAEEVVEQIGAPHAQCTACGS